MWQIKFIHLKERLSTALASKAILSQYSQRLAKLESLFKNSDDNLNENFKKVINI